MFELTDVRYGTVLLNAFWVKSVMQIGENVVVYMKQQPRLIVSESYQYIVDKIDGIIGPWVARKVKEFEQ